MYGMMLEFDPMMVAVVTRGHKEGINFGSVDTDSEARGTKYASSGGDGVGRKRECWNYGGENLKRNCPKLGKGITKKDEDTKWYI